MQTGKGGCYLVTVRICTCVGEVAWLDVNELATQDSFWRFGDARG